MKTKEIPITVTFRHLDPSEPLRAHAEKKIGGACALIHGATEAHVILSAEKNHRHHAEVTVHGGGHHHVLVANGDGVDMYASIDQAAQRLDHQARKFKERMIDEPRRSGNGGTTVAGS